MPVLSQMLQCIDADSYALYKPLIFTPLLMFEQLLMNAKITWAQQVVDFLRDSTSNSFNFTQEVDELLISYAEKAVHFPILSLSPHALGLYDLCMTLNRVLSITCITMCFGFIYAKKLLSYWFHKHNIHN